MQKNYVSFKGRQFVVGVKREIIHITFYMVYLAKA